METRIELEELLKLLEAKQYTNVRQFLAELNVADIAVLMEELEEEGMLKVFRILPKDLAAEVFSYLEVDSQHSIINSLSEREAGNIIDNLMADDGFSGGNARQCGGEASGQRQPGHASGSESASALSGGLCGEYYDRGICVPEGDADRGPGH